MVTNAQGPLMLGELYREWESHTRKKVPLGWRMGAGLLQLGGGVVEGTQGPARDVDKCSVEPTPPPPMPWGGAAKWVGELLPEELVQFSWGLEEVPEPM